MPGAKRRALKKLLSPQSSPSQTPVPTSDSAQSINNSSSNNNALSPPLSETQSSTSLASSVSTSTTPKSPKKSHSHFSLFGHKKDTSTEKVNGLSESASASASATMNNPNNYMSDEALQQDLVVEEMIERGNSIGSGNHLAEDGIGSLNPNGNNIGNASLPPPPPPSTLPPTGAANLPPPPAPQGQTISPPPPPTGISGNADKGLYKPTPQQVTAEQLIFGDGGNGGKGGKKKSSKQRFAERQARKKETLLNSAPPSDPAWTAQLEKERLEEIQVISDACEVLGREIYEIAPDGHCMFNAIADQLHLIGLIPAKEAQNPHYTRKTAANYMLAHPDDFMPFLPSITGEDSAGATDDGVITPKEFEKYCSLVAETGEWGGEPEIQALSRAFRVPIHVIQRGPPTIVSHGGLDDSFGGSLTPQQSLQQGEKIVRISYHKRMYGLGEHYNSLRRSV